MLWTPDRAGLKCGMPKYRIYLSEGRQIDIDAHEHRAFSTDKTALGRVDFFDDRGAVVASFAAAALHGYTRIDNLASQREREV